MSQIQIKVSRGGLKAHALGLLQKQKGLCAVCQKPIDITTQGRSSDYVVDHCHVTGVIRGVLHRSCNSCLGKAEQAIGSWGSKSKKIEDIIPYMKLMIKYYEEGLSNPSNFVYPTHKTPLEKKLALATKRRAEASKRKLEAKKKVTQVMKKRGTK